MKNQLKQIKKAWKKAKKKETSFKISNREYVLIGASAGAGAIISTFLTRINFEQVKKITPWPFIDFILYSILLTVFVILIVQFILKLLYYNEIQNNFQEIFFKLKKKKNYLML